MNEWFDYNPDSGEVRWKKSPSSKIRVGDLLNYKTEYGYYRVSLNYKKYLVHRLAWFLYYGNWPEGTIDHINWDRTDNRILNLRDISPTENKKHRKPTNKRNTDAPQLQPI